MRRLAAETGLAPNALYTYFTDKTAILDSLLDALLGEIEVPPPTNDWQKDLTVLMGSSRHVLLRHPRLIQLFLTRPGGANALRLGEAALQSLARGGIHGRDAVIALRTLLAFTLGFTAIEAPRADQTQGPSRREEAIGAIRELPPAEFPLTRHAEADLASRPDDQEFETGLQWILSGLTGSAA